MCRRHLRNIAFTSVPSVTPCAHYISLLVYHPIFRKNLLLPCYYVFHYPILCLPLPCTMSLITLYHVSYYSVPCLLLLCLMPSITLLPCLLLHCYHVFHYSVTMSSITLLPCLLLPCLHQGMQNHKKELTS